MIASERLSYIVHMVNERGFVSTKELSETTSVSEMTIRRDCEELEKKGLIIRVHGGAKRVLQREILSNKDDMSMSERLSHFEEKDLVCRKAASFVRDGDCIFLDGGTSVVHILKYLKGKKVKIVTCSTLIASAFDDPESELFMVGGKYIPRYNMSVGPITLSDLEKFNFDFAFLSCSGVDLDRHLIYTAEMDTMAVKQKAMELAVRKYLLVDASKLSVKGFCSFISSDDFDAVICNQEEHMNLENLPINYILVDDE